MSTEREDPTRRAPDPEEERLAEELRRALEDGAPPGGSADTERLVRTAHWLRPAAPRIPDLTRQRVWRRLREAMTRRVRRSPWRRPLWAAAAVAVAAGVAGLVVFLRAPARVEPATRYAALFRAPFARESRALERLERIIAWRQETSREAGSR